MHSPRRTSPLLPSFILLVTGFLAAVASPADRVFLTNGKVLEGASRVVEGGKVAIDLPFGTMTLPADQVLRIEQAATLEQEVYRELNALAAGDAQGRYLLGLWAREEGSETLARRLFEAALEVDPDHPGARQELGFLLHDGRWVTEDALRALRGEVQVRGRWMSREVAGQLLLQEAQAESARRLDAQYQRARLEALSLELEAEREAREEREAVDGIPLYPGYYDPYGVYGGPYGGVVTGPLVGAPVVRYHSQKPRSGPSHVQRPQRRSPPGPVRQAPPRTSGGRARYQ